MTYIYGLVCPIVKQIRYVGKSRRPRGRLIAHCSRHAAEPIRDWIRSLRGGKPGLCILAGPFKNEEDASEIERLTIEGLIDDGAPLLNIHNCPGAAERLKLSQAAVQRLRSNLSDELGSRMWDGAPAALDIEAFARWCAWLA